MFLRSLLICAFLMGAIFAGNIDKTRKDFSNPSEDNQTSPKGNDTVVQELDRLKAQYLDLRNMYDTWMADPYHKYVILPAAIGAASALLTMIFLSILYCCCKRCISKRFGYRKLNESSPGWFGRRTTSHDS